LEAVVSMLSRHIHALGDHLIRGLHKVGIGLVGSRVRAHRSHIYVLDVPTDEWLQYVADKNVRASPEREAVASRSACLTVSRTPRGS
jgi:cysteine desulfurase/selenocysteine lyase